MSEKTIKEVVADFQKAFGRVEFMAENMQTGQKGVSKGWQEAEAHRLEINADDYLSLSNCNISSGTNPAAWAGVAKLLIGRK